MGILIVGNGGTVAEVDGTSFRALRSVARPIEHGAGGHYKASFLTGSIAAGAQTNGEILQFRNVSASLLLIPTYVVIDGVIATTAFAAGAIGANVIAARGWSADGTGGNAVTLTGNNNKRRASHATSSLSTGARIATTAALGAGTKTFDANPFGQWLSHTAAFGVNAAPAPQVQSLMNGPIVLANPDIGHGEHPFAFVQNEGFAVRVTTPATGVHQWGVTVSWMEVPAF